MRKTKSTLGGSEVSHSESDSIELPLSKTTTVLFIRVARVASISCAAYAAVIITFGAEPLKLVAPAFIFFASLLGIFMHSRVNPRSSVLVFFVLTWSAVAIQSMLVGGLQNPVLHVNAILVTLCGWLISLTAAGFLLLLSLGWVFGMYVFHAQSLSTSPLTSAEVSQVVAMSAIWIASFFVLRLVLEEHFQRLSDIAELEKSVIKKKQMLDRQIVVSNIEREKVNQLLGASPLPITVANFKSGVYVDVNPAWEKFFGFQKTEVLGKTSIDLGFWPDTNQRQGWIDQFKGAGRVSGYEVVFKLRDGTVRDFLLSSERFLYGQEVCVLTMSVDITQRKKLEADLRILNGTLESRVAERTIALEETNRELLETLTSLNLAQVELIQSEKLASLGSLVASLSHEINTPIGNALVTATSITDSVVTVKSQVASGNLRRSEFFSFIARQEEGSELIRRSLERAANLISSFKQVAVDQMSEQRRDFDIAVTTKEVIDTQIPGLKKRGVSVQLDMQYGILVDSYPGPYGQVVMNCVNNALVHAFENVNTPELKVSLFPVDQDTVCVEIADNGVGIADELLGRVFDPFFTTKMGKGGSGIGLAISHRLVTNVLGGSIGVQSSLGCGTTFNILFPRHAPIHKLA